MGVVNVSVVGTVGTVGKDFFSPFILTTEQLIVLVHDIFDGGFVRVLAGETQSD